MDSPRVSVAVVGGGITGLATSYYLERAAEEEGWELDGVLIEQDGRLGGKLVTVEEDGFIVEGGPDSFLAQKPWALRLIAEMGMEDELLYGGSHRVGLLSRGRLHGIPDGLVGVAPTRPWALWAASFLSLRGKLRASLEPFVPRARDSAPETVAGFFRRRLGVELSQALAEPFTAGIYAGDAEELGLRDTFPMLSEMEQKHGSLARGIRAARSGRGSGNGASRPAFASLRRGMASLPSAVAGALTRFDVRLGRGVTDLAVDAGSPRRYGLALSGGDAVSTDCVVLAVPAHRAAEIVRAAVPLASRTLGRSAFASTASVTLAFRRDAVGHRLDGSGFVVPRAETSALTACSYSSSKWPGRSPDGRVLVRAFLGWRRDDTFAKRDDASLIALVTEELRPLLALRGQAESSWVHRWPMAMPQYRVGHRKWVGSVESALAAHPGLLVAGASYGGVGVPDCVRQGREAAEAIRCHISGRPNRPSSEMVGTAGSR
jgi:oxygen-dependent protoporphyrinogen oxidase